MLPWDNLKSNRSFCPNKSWQALIYDSHSSTVGKSITTVCMMARHVTLRIVCLFACLLANLLALRLLFFYYGAKRSNYIFSFFIHTCQTPRMLPLLCISFLQTAYVTFMYPFCFLIVPNQVVNFGPLLVQ